jgi:O-antigen/teichoic acid export membrane protein
VRAISLRVGFSWTLIGQVVDAAAKTALLMAIARLSSASVLGQYALGLAISAPVMLFANLQLAAVQATDRAGGFQFNDYFTLRAAAVGVGVIAVGAIGMLVPTQSGTFVVVTLVGIAKGVDAIADVFHGLFQQHERMEWVAKSQVLRALLGAVAFVGTFAATGRLAVAVVALACASLGVVYGWDAKKAFALLRDLPHDCGSISLRSTGPTLRRLVMLSAPLGVVSLVDSFNANVPRYILQYCDGESAVGHYSALAYMVVVGGTVTTALSYSLRPRLAALYVADVAQYRQLLRKLMAVGTVLGASGIAVATVAGRPVLTLLYGREYAESAGVLVWLMVGAAAWYTATCLAVGLTAARQFAIQTPIIVTSTLVTAAFAALLVPKMGASGAALAFGAGMAARLVMVSWAYWSCVRPGGAVTHVGSEGDA